MFRSIRVFYPSAALSIHFIHQTSYPPANQSKYLIDVATRFQEVASLALDAKYWGNDIFNQHSNLKLATLMVNRSEAFSKMVEEMGHTYQFEAAIKSLPEPLVWHPLKFSSDQETETGGHPKLFATRLNDNHEEIEDILCDNEELDLPKSQGILSWLTEVYRASRGFELGTFDPSLLAITMKEQSKKWDSIALGYISDVVTMVHNFVTQLLQLICPDERVRNGLTSVLTDSLLERYKKAVAQVAFILQVERSEKPATQNHYFNDTLEKCRQKRMQQVMSEKSFDDCSHGTVVRLKDVMSHHPMSNIEHTVQDLHDILKSYYQVAWKRVVDVVCMQAAEHHLISGPTTPLKLFSPAFVGIMTPEQLEEVAGEDPRQKRTRKQLLKEMEDLEKGKKILT
ncbi:hypothetical protein B0J14DRAFT_478419 [Halenospora varia]|nr:hypothetical protein B0J14DRAFT_478419 [Halenospora varia]